MSEPVTYEGFLMLDTWLVAITYLDTSGKIQDHEMIVGSKLEAEVTVAKIFAGGLCIEQLSGVDGEHPPDSPEWYVYPPHRIVEGFFFQQWEKIEGSTND